MVFDKNISKFDTCFNLPDITSFCSDVPYNIKNNIKIKLHKPT